MLRNATVAMINSSGAKSPDCMIAKSFDSDANMLLKWGESHGMRTKLKIACKS